MKDVKVVDAKGVVSLIQVPIEDDVVEIPTQNLNVSKEDVVAVVDEMVDNGFISDKEAKKLKESLGETYDQIIEEGGIMGIEEKEGCNCGGNCGNGIDKRSTFSIAQKLIKDRQLAGGRMGVNDDLCNTNLISKNYSPMFIRKFNASQLCNWPLYCSMICDEDVSDIDKVVNGALKAYDAAGLMGNNLQSMRNLTGIISETLSIYYNNKKENCVEGIAVTLYIDKAYIQSFTGDFMNHAQCRQEYTAALNMMTQI